MIDALLVPGQISYTDSNGRRQTFLFQFNPTNLKRSRSVSFQESGVSDKRGSSIERGKEGRKFSLTADRWKIDLEIRIDADRSGLTTGPVRAMSPLAAVQADIAHLEALVEPGAPPSENDSTHGFQDAPDPPPVEFSWGLRTWVGFVTSVSIDETRFNPLLMPTRVEAILSMVVIDTVQQVALGKLGGRR